MRIQDMNTPDLQALERELAKDLTNYNWNRECSLLTKIDYPMLHNYEEEAMSCSDYSLFWWCGLRR